MIRNTGLAFLLSLIIAFNLAAFYCLESTFVRSVEAGALPGIG